MHVRHRDTLTAKRWFLALIEERQYGYRLKLRKRVDDLRLPTHIWKERAARHGQGTGRQNQAQKERPKRIFRGDISG
jgi:hypothetical protein